MRTWLVAGGLVIIAAMSYVYVLPVYFDVIGIVDTAIEDSGLTGTPKDTYDSVKTNTTDVAIYSGVAFILIYIIWAFISMSKKERYTGYYAEYER